MEYKSVLIQVPILNFDISSKFKLHISMSYAYQRYLFNFILSACPYSKEVWATELHRCRIGVERMYEINIMNLPPDRTHHKYYPKCKNIIFLPGKRLAVSIRTYPVCGSVGERNTNEEQLSPHLFFNLISHVSGK